jgi:hypothetical protein
MADPEDRPPARRPRNAEEIVRALGGGVDEDVAGRGYWTALHFNKSERGYKCDVGEGELPERLRILSARQPSQTPP